jgi:membrane-bound lytic murein transglycosylase D
MFRGLLKQTLFFLFLISFNSFADEVDGSSTSFYKWVAESQVMNSNSLAIEQNAIKSDNATVERIANSTPMLKFYADELNRNGVPLDFLILPLIESGNNPQARSPKNALGLWQFMPFTGMEWGLGATQTLDDRVDVQKSTAAAAAYLKSLYNQFNDWNLVLASYNWGSASVNKALRKGLKYNDGRIDLSLLPEETRKYLIAFYAFNHIIHDNHNKLPLAQYPNRPFLAKIQSNNLATYIQSVPALSNVSESVLKHMNGFDLKVADSSPRIMLVPTETFAKYFMTSKISFKITSSTQVVSNCNNPGKADYKIKYGETIESISRKFKMSVNKLIEINPTLKYARPGISLSLC